MSFQRDPYYWSQATRIRGNTVTFCSCVPARTKVEQNSTKREIMVMWLKDAAAGAGLVLFMVTSFVLASGAHAALNHL
jgi:hypothetical protein